LAVTDEPTERFESRPVVDTVRPSAIHQPGLSGAVTAAGVIPVAIGGMLGSVAFFAMLAWALIGVNLSEQSGLSEEQRRAGLALGQTFFAAGSVGLALAIAHLTAGIGVLMRRRWARLLGVTLGVVGAAVWALVLLSTIVVAVPPVPADSTLTPEEYEAVVRVGFIFVRGLAVVGLVASIFAAEVLGRRRSEFA
jgi:hypothetical protein